MAIVLVTFGAAAIARQVSARYTFLILLAAPAAGLGAATLGKYPLAMRLALWLIPVAIILLAGVLCLPGRVAWTMLLPVVLVGGSSIVAGLAAFPFPLQSNDARGTYAFVSRHWRAGDILLTNPPAEPTYLYYAPRYHLHRTYLFDFYSRSQCAPPALLTTSRARIWIVVNQHGSTEPANGTSIYLANFEQHGTLEESFRGAGDAGAFLLDLSRPPPMRVTPLASWVRDGCLTIIEPPKGF
jgi:hypothetical protein